MSIKTIAVDFDDVLCHYTRGVIEWHNKMYGTDTKFTDLTSTLFKPYWKCEWPEVRERIALYSKTLDYLTLPMTDGAREGLRQLTLLGYKIIIVTARDLSTQAVTEQWLQNNGLDGYVTGIYFTSDKLKVCQEMNAIALIDDSPSHIMKCSSLPHTILFNYNNSYNWATTNESDCHILSSWQSISDYFSHV